MCTAHQSNLGVRIQLHDKYCRKCKLTWAMQMKTIVTGRRHQVTLRNLDADYHFKIYQATQPVVSLSQWRQHQTQVATEECQANQRADRAGASLAPCVEIRRVCAYYMVIEVPDLQTICHIKKTNSNLTMGARRGGTCPPPLEFEKNDVICCRPTKYPKLFDRHRYPIFQSKTAQKTLKFSFAPFARRKR